MTWRELLEKGKEALAEADIEDAAQDAWYLLEHVSRMGRAGYFLHREEQALPAACGRYLELLGQRSRHVPLQYLTGIQEFMGLPFRVTPDVLVPRQDTELLAEWLLSVCDGKRVLDLCTGSGCIAVSAAKLGNPCLVEAVDISAAALEVAAGNAARMGADVRFRQGDLYEGIDGRYDIIVSNPPYIRSGILGTLMPEVRVFEPELALDGGEDGLAFYRRILADAGRYLEPGGVLAVEIGFDQAGEVQGIFEENGFCHVACRQDLCGNDRMIIGYLCQNIRE